MEEKKMLVNNTKATITLDKLKKIAASLPISFYTKRSGIRVEVSETEETSYFNPKEDKIVISYQNLLPVLDKIKQDWDAERIVRGLFYHEISHTIMTPPDLKYGYQHPYPDVFNIFEDERQETILKDYFYGVNFKQNCILLNNYHGEPPQSAMEAFFHTVRFRSGKPEFVKEVGELIEKYAHITNETNRYTYQPYQQDMKEFFIKVTRDWLEENDPETLDKEASGCNNDSNSSSTDSPETPYAGNYNKLPEDTKNRVVERIMEKQVPKTKTVYVKPVPGTPGEPGDGKEPGKPMEGYHIPSYEDENDEKLAEMERKISRNCTEHLDKTKTQKMVNKYINQLHDPIITDKMGYIFERFNSKQSGIASVRMAHTGKINPRLVTREDYKWFTRRANQGALQGFEKFHLNLFIDTSGSYCGNEKQTNMILKSLIEMENKYKFFSFDLATMQRSVTLKSKNERFISTGGGNDFGPEAVEVFRKMKDPRALNYTIVLFDGDGWSDTPYNAREEHQSVLKIFDNRMCSIISDEDNKAAIEKYCPGAHKIFVGRWNRSGDNRSYSELLLDNVLVALNKAMG